MSLQTKAPELDRIAGIAGESAMYLLDEGLEFLDGFVAGNDLSKISAAHAVLIVGFALIKQRELHYEESRAGEQPQVTQQGASATRRQHDYEWLKWLVEKAMPNMSEAEQGEAVAHIARLVGV